MDELKVKLSPKQGVFFEGCIEMIDSLIKLSIATDYPIDDLLKYRYEFVNKLHKE